MTSTFSPSPVSSSPFAFTPNHLHLKVPLLRVFVFPTISPTQAPLTTLIPFRLRMTAVASSTHSHYYTQNIISSKFCKHNVNHTKWFHLASTSDSDRNRRKNCFSGFFNLPSLSFSSSLSDNLLSPLIENSILFLLAACLSAAIVLVFSLQVSVFAFHAIATFSPRFLFQSLSAYFSSVAPTIFTSHAPDLAFQFNEKAVSVSISAILKLLSSIALGILAKKLKILDQTTVSALTKVVFNIFLPSVLFTSVILTLKQNASWQLALIPALGFLQLVAGGLVGCIMAALIFPKSKNTKEDNADDKGLLIASCAFGNGATLPNLLVGSIFAPNPVKALSYVSLFTLVWSPLFWSVGYALLARKKTNDTAPTNKSNLQFQLLLKRVLAPPIIGCISGLIVGLIPQIRDTLISTLAPLFESLVGFGTAYTPVSVLILATSLVPDGNTSKLDESIVSKHLTKRMTFPLIVLATCLARFILVPFIAVGILKLAAKFGFCPHDPLSQFILLLVSVMPSAQNASIVPQLENNRVLAAKLGKLLILVYALSVIPISIAISIFLTMTGVS